MSEKKDSRVIKDCWNVKITKGQADTSSMIISGKNSAGKRIAFTVHVPDYFFTYMVKEMRDVLTSRSAAVNQRLEDFTQTAQGK
ncbi:hypothetical protein JMG10_07700 [Nostoc ellipsosporum NOK]|nr:hypothetical protein [Nostoc ellipsosporum NOK]